MKITQLLTILMFWVCSLAFTIPAYSGTPNPTTTQQAKIWAQKIKTATPQNRVSQKVTKFWDVHKHHFFTKFFVVGLICLIATCTLLYLSQNNPSLWVAGIIAGIATCAFLLLWVIEVLTSRKIW